MSADSRQYSIYRITNELIPNECLYSMSLLGKAGISKTVKNMLNACVSNKLDSTMEYARILNKDTKWGHIHLEFVEGGIASKDLAEKRKRELSSATPSKSMNDPTAEVKLCIKHTAKPLCYQKTPHEKDFVYQKYMSFFTEIERLEAERVKINKRIVDIRMILDHFQPTDDELCEQRLKDDELYEQRLKDEGKPLPTYEHWL